MILRPCLDCGEPSQASRCPAHAGLERKATARQRGYDARHDALSRRARKLQPFCGDCGAVEDLQCHHLPEAWRRKAIGLVIRLVDVEVLCGPCNRDRGPARGGTPHPRRPGPALQPNTALYSPQHGVT